MIQYNNFITNERDIIKNSLTVKDVVNILKKYINKEYDNLDPDFSGLHDIIKSYGGVNNFNVIVIDVNIGNVHVHTCNDSYYFEYPYNNNIGNCVDKFTKYIIFPKSFDILFLAKHMTRKNRFKENYIDTPLYETDFSTICNIRDKANRISELCNKMLEHMDDDAIK